MELSGSVQYSIGPNIGFKFVSLKHKTFPLPFIHVGCYKIPITHKLCFWLSICLFTLLLKEGIRKVLENDLPLIKDGITPEGKTFHWFFRIPFQYLCKKPASPPFLIFSGKKNVTPLIKNSSQWQRVINSFLKGCKASAKAASSYSSIIIIWLWKATPSSEIGQFCYLKKDEVLPFQIRCLNS